MMQKNSVSDGLSEIGKITLWGPTGSGKTWLLHAFSKTLLKYSIGDPDFLYELTDADRTPLDFFTPQNINPTYDIEDTVFRFRRIGKKNTSAHRVSSSEQKISIIDNKGDALTSLKSIMTSESIIDSPNIILLLDVTKSLLGLNADLMNSGDLPSIHPKEYTGMVDNLLQLLAKSSDEERYIAVCLSKSDQFSVKGRETKSLIRMLFGSDMVNLFGQFKTKPNLKFEFFTVSSVGFLRDDKPNYDMNSGNLIDMKKWDPYNVEFPFFWFFENIERKRISQIGGNIVSRFLAKSRLKEYIPYPRPPK